MSDKFPFQPEGMGTHRENSDRKGRRKWRSDARVPSPSRNEQKCSRQVGGKEQWLVPL